MLTLASEFTVDVPLVISAMLRLMLSTPSKYWSLKAFKVIDAVFSPDRTSTLGLSTILRKTAFPLSYTKALFSSTNMEIGSLNDASVPGPSTYKRSSFPATVESLYPEVVSPEATLVTSKRLVEVSMVI